MDLKTIEINSFFLTIQEKRIDIVLISEIHFTNTFYVNFPGYHTYHANHSENSAYTGTAIFIKSSLAYIYHYLTSIQITSNRM
jgi:exonuclease III